MADEIVDTVDRQISELLTKDDVDTSSISNSPKYIYSLFTKTGTPLYTAPEI